jgi:hypothetical protein
MERGEDRSNGERGQKTSKETAKGEDDKTELLRSSSISMPQTLEIVSLRKNMILGASGPSGFILYIPVFSVMSRDSSLNTVKL